MNANTKLVGPNVDVSSPVYLAVLERVDFRFSQIGFCQSGKEEGRERETEYLRNSRDKAAMEDRRTARMGGAGVGEGSVHGLEAS